MTTQKNRPWIVRLAPLAAALPLLLGNCSGGNGSTSDAGTTGTKNNGTSGGESSGASSSGSNFGVGDNSGGSSSGASSSGASKSGGSSGGITDGGGADSGQNAGVKCTSGPGMPPAPPGCVQCLSGADCPTAMPHCLNGACVACATSADCGNGTTPVCWPGDHTCHGACGEGGATCPTGIGQPSHCDAKTGACVGCADSTQCPTLAPICDSTTKECVQCEVDPDCAGATPHCDRTTHACVVCATNADCAGSAGGPVCRTTYNFMTGQATRSCQPGCASNAQCTDAGASVCDSNGTCVQCVDDSACSGTKPVCDQLPMDPVYHTCVECTPAGGGAATRGCDGGPSSCYLATTPTYHYACH